MHVLLLLALSANVRADDVPKTALDQPDVFFDQRAPAQAAPQPVVAPVPAPPVAPSPAPAPSTGWHPKHSFGATVGIATATGITAGGIAALITWIGGSALPGIGWAALIGFGVGAVIGILAGLFG